MSLRLTAVHAVEILDSRGRPTLAVDLSTPDGTFSTAVPSGASTGSGEAVELRDGDAARFEGKGVLTAVGHVNGELAELLLSRDWPDLATLDDAMITTDGTPNKSRLGANALVGGSNRAVNLQPFSVQAQIGVDVAAGVTAMTLEYAPPPPVAPPPRPRRHKR